MQYNANGVKCRADEKQEEVMRNNTRYMKLVLTKLLERHRRRNNKSGVPKKKIPITQVCEKREFMPSERFFDFNARIPSHLKGIKGSIPDLIRAAYAIGRAEGILITERHHHLLRQNKGGTITTTVF